MLKIAIVVFPAMYIVFLITRTSYYKALRDGILPSGPMNVNMQAKVSDSELKVSYKWWELKEFYTFADYIVIRYDPENIELNYDGLDGSKELYKSVRYLRGDFSKILPSSSKRELVIPIEHDSKEGQILIPIKKQDAEIKNITIYYAHDVSLPMDSPAGWVSKEIDTVH